MLGDCLLPGGTVTPVTSEVAVPRLDVGPRERQVALRSAGECCYRRLP
jgi:hypothetical protein